jgi:dihydroflavonol-4-reductase
MTRALVTGSTGGVGANLVAALNARGIDVVGLRRKSSPNDAVEGLKLDFAVGDILDAASLPPAMEGVDWVFHVAAIADDWNYPAETVYRVNVEGTRNVLEAALAAGVKRLVLTSSSSALGIPTRDGELMTEENQFNLNPRDWAYGHSKHLAEQLMREYVDRGLHAVSVLPSAVMGPRDLKFISGELLVRALKREIFPLPDGGLNFIDVRDLVEGHIAAAEKGRAGERYVLAGHNMTHGESLAIIGQVLSVPIQRIKVPRWVLPPLAEVVTLLHKMGVKLPVERGRVLLSGKFIYYDNAKAVRELGLAVRPFAETVRDAYQWYAEHRYFEKRGIALH